MDMSGRGNELAVRGDVANKLASLFVTSFNLGDNQTPTLSKVLSCWNYRRPLVEPSS